MDAAEAWVKLLYTYGPFAILIFFVFVTERKTRAAKNEAKRDEKSKMLLLYMLNWIVIFGLVCFSLYAWSRMNLSEEAEIKGHIANLTGKEVASTRRPASLFLNRDYLGAGRADYLWRLVAPKRFNDGDRVTIVFDPGLGESFVTDNELTIRSSFYERDVGISYNRETNKLYVVEEGGKLTELPQSHQVFASQPEPEPTWNFFSTVAYAQGGFNGEAFAASLESPDPVIRRNARSDLAKQGGAAIPWINNVLSNSGTSYRLKVGIIVALNRMTYVNGMLQPAALATIQSAAFDKDDTLRNESVTFLEKNRIPFPVTVYEHSSFAGRNQGFVPGQYRADYGQLGKLPNDSASSLRVQKGFRVRLCENEGNGRGSGRCQEFREGSWELKWSRTSGVADRVSYVDVRSEYDFSQQQKAP